MPAIPSNKPYRVGRSPTGLGLFAPNRSRRAPNRPLFWAAAGLQEEKRRRDREQISVRAHQSLDHRWFGARDIARYINHACKPNAESDVRPRKRKVFIRAIKNIEPGDEINYDYGTDYFKAYLKPIGCKCAACEKKRKKKRAEARAEKLRLKAKAERKALKKAEKLAKAKKELRQKLRLNGAKANGKSRNGMHLNGKSPSGKHLNGNSRTGVAGMKSAAAKRRAPAPAEVLRA